DFNGAAHAGCALTKEQTSGAVATDNRRMTNGPKHPPISFTSHTSRRETEGKCPKDLPFNDLRPSDHWNFPSKNPKREARPPKPSSPCRSRSHNAKSKALNIAKHLAIDCV